jgi:hypothetical protein
MSKDLTVLCLLEDGNLSKPLKQRDFAEAGTHLAGIGAQKRSYDTTAVHGQHQIDARSFLSGSFLTYTKFSAALNRISNREIASWVATIPGA